MKKLLIGLIAMVSLSASAEYIEGQGKISVSSGFYQSANQNKGLNLKIQGKAAKVLFDEISYEDIQGPGAISGQEIRQTEFVQCVKYSKREIECRILLNSDGTPASMSHLQLNY